MGISMMSTGGDFLNNDNNPGEFADDPFHGTGTSCTVAGVGNDSFGVTGICWQGKVMPLQWIGPLGGNLGDALAALEYAVLHGAKVSNNSFGFGLFSQAFEDAIAAAGAQGHIYVSGAGNGGLPQTNYPTLYDLPNILSVAALNGRDWLTSFANYNQISVDLGAPAHFIAIGSTQTNGTQAHFTASGASFAGPQVAGAAALLWGHKPQLTMAEVIDRILCSARTRSRSGRISRHRRCP